MSVEDVFHRIDHARESILKGWTMRVPGGKPDGSCLMSALTNLRLARDELRPRTGERLNADGTVSR